MTSQRFRLIHQGNNENKWSNIHTIELPGIAVAKELIKLEPKPEEKPSTKNNGSPKSLETRQQAYADLIWALINTKEFQFNH